MNDRQGVEDILDRFRHWLETELDEPLDPDMDAEGAAQSRTGRVSLVSSISSRSSRRCVTR